MKTQINLILEKEGVKKDVRKFLYIALGIFAVSIIFTGGLLIYRFIIDRQYNALVANEKEINAQIDQQKEKKSKLQDLKARMTEISSVLGKRGILTKNLTDILLLMPDTIGIESMDLEPGKATLNIESFSLNDINEFYSTLFSLNLGPIKTEIKQIKLSSFSVDNKKAIYESQIDFIY